MKKGQLVILFDGVCNFCDQSVQFILKRDKEEVFQFASLQSAYGQKFLEAAHLNQHNFSSMILVEDSSYYMKSAAVLRICKHLKGFYRLLYVLILVPKPLRDYLYDLIANNRYKWFGKKESCSIPSKEVRERFLN
ncbi:DUF393 domain-containing protein [Bacillus lacus]|uniref:DUF393 domain-containing protein n=1 Tax=Metabacillus lacus TaxID=1983721 RepID=A0A7X2M009_9BACI|nr:thiol-disulfide oxidoreductase DCC family protein [Metabacillus lacus]MRX73583.1 DUF393 domain-containing protein [Metabacillus lacus]